MKKKQILFLGFAVILIPAIIALAGCKGEKDKGAKFPSAFIGTWKRPLSPYNYTLTISSKTLKASNQNFHWILQSVSGDVYTMTLSVVSDYIGKTAFRLVNGSLEIREDHYQSTPHYNPEYDWSGIWERQSGVALKEQ
jgi:hypothetical protein